jgi:hypothetical protein
VPSYKLAKTFTQLLQLHIPLPYAFNVKNSAHLINDIAGNPHDPNLRMASLDINNMYTNIPTNDLIQIIEKWCDLFNVDTSVKQEILKITSLLVRHNHFEFKEKTYIQKKGLAMGAPTSYILSEIFLQYLENTVIYDILKKGRHNRLL